MAAVVLFNINSMYLVLATDGWRKKFTKKLVDEGYLFLQGWPESIPIKAPNNLSAEEVSSLYQVLDSLRVERAVTDDVPVDTPVALVEGSTVPQIPGNNELLGGEEVETESQVERGSPASVEADPAQRADSEDELQPSRRRYPRRATSLLSKK